jgi:hypothetical protein
MAAADPVRSLALPAGGGTQTALGPNLTPGMGEQNLIEKLNAWGSARDHEILELQAGIRATQVGVSSAFDQAKATVISIVTNFRAEAETLRQHGLYEATSSVGRLEQVVFEARKRFDEQDSRFADDLAELARRLAVVDA